MGKINMKLMQGIDDTAKQINKEKEAAEHNVSGTENNRETSKESSNTAMQNLDIPPKITADTFKAKEPETKKRAPEESVIAKPIQEVKKQVFSFRAAVNDINVWKAFATASGRTMESIGSAAMNEYMKRHKLSEAEAAVFRALLAKHEDKQTCGERR